ncbi:hypothetical protein Tco_0289599 [Tanacetum coccineum]
MVSPKGLTMQQLAKNRANPRYPVHTKTNSCQSLYLTIHPSFSFNPSPQKFSFPSNPTSQNTKGHLSNSLNPHSSVKEDKEPRVEMIGLGDQAKWKARIDFGLLSHKKHTLGKILFPNSSMNSFFPQERQISEMKSSTFNNVLMNRFMRHGTITRISFVNHGFTELHQLDTFYNALNPADQDSLISATGGNPLERRTQDVLTIIKNKSKVRNSRNKSIVSQMKSSDVNSSSSSEISKLTHAVNQQTSAVTTAMTAILK